MSSYKIVWFNPKLQDWDEVDEHFESEASASRFLERNPHIRKSDEHSDADPGL